MTWQQPAPRTPAVIACDHKGCDRTTTRHNTGGWHEHTQPGRPIRHTCPAHPEGR